MAARSSAKTKKLIQTARDRWKTAQKSDKEQREREKADIDFFNGNQWPQDIIDIRKGQDAQNSLPPVPARPMITINKTRGPVQQVLNQERQSDMGIEIVPADDFGDLDEPIDETEIKLREGLTRRIQRDSKAADARTWAFGRATIAGRGFYGVMTRFAPGKTNDQEVYVHRFYNQSCVTIDPAHEQPDGSDAEWEMVWADIPWERYKSEYGTRNGKPNRVCGYSDSEWRAAGDDRPDWFVTEGDKRTMRVGDYWYTERKTRTLATLGDGSVEWKDELPDGIEIFDERPVVQKVIKFCKIDGCDDDVLEETDWLGPDMPIVKVVGEELQPTDGKRHEEGMVRPMREPCYGFNVMVSRWIEVIGLAPLTPAMIEEGTVEGYEAWWEAANTRTLPYLPYKKTALDGTPANPPTVPPARNPDISAIASSVQMFDESIQSTSGHPDVSLGKVDPSIKSGRAIKALQEKAAFSSNHYLDNLQRSIRYEGQIINNLLFPIYGRPGRIARIINGEGDAETVLLHQPMVMQGAKPVPAQPNQEGAKTYTLTENAQFNVIVKVSKNFDSRREQEVAIIGELLTQAPELMTWFGDLFFQNQDGPGHQQMADRAKVMLDPKIQQMIAAKANGQDVPPAVQAQLAGAQQQIEQLTAELQKATAPGAVAQVKAQSDLEMARLDAESKRAIEAAKLAQKNESEAAQREMTLTVAQIGADVKLMIDSFKLFAAERARVGVRDHEAGMAGMEQQHAREMAERGHEQSLEAGAVAAETQGEQAEADRQHQAAMQTDAQRAAADQAKVAAAAKPKGTM